MKSLWIYLLLIAALSVAGNLTLIAQSPEQLYQKGLMKEEGEGALKDAINLYNQIADNAAADQSLRAKALLHIGMCYERMGTKEAVKAYQRLVNSYPTQKNEVAIARERLNRLIMADKLVQQDVKKDLLIRKVLPDTDIEPLGAPSPDGRHISFIDWSSGGNLGILDLETNEKRCLTDFKDPNEMAYYSSWSPDGKQIACFWWDNKDQYHLSIVDLKKSESRILYKSDKIDWIELGNWSSDGKYIFATLSLKAEPKSQIVRISAVDGTLEVLITCEESYTGGKPYVSPDSRFVAYDLTDKDASGNSDIFLLSIVNGKRNTLIEHSSHDYMLGWSSDGKNILFATDRSGTVDVMLISVEEGNPVGQPKTVIQNIGPIVPMGFTKDGSFFYGQWPGADNIYFAEMNIDEGKLISKPNLLVERFVGRNYSPAYSSDGKHLAYISSRGVMNKGKPGPVLCIRNLETGEELEVNPGLPNASHVSDLIWSPDDHSLALGSVNQDRYSSIYRYDIETRQFSPLVPDSEGHPSDINYAYPVWSKNGKSIFYLKWNRYSETSLIMVRNISTGIERELYRYSSDDIMDRLFNIALSPDGRWLAAINRGEKRIVRMISTDDEEVRDLYKFNSPGGFPYSPVWSKDGKFILFPYQKMTNNNYLSREWSMIRIPVDGGDSLRINMGIRGVSSPTLHPDGQTLAFRSAGTSFPENNIWEMKYFLPQEKELQTMVAEEPEGIKVRQIWKQPYLDFLGSVSSDGRLLSYIDWGNGDVAVHNILTGEDHILTHQADLGDSAHFAQCPKISKNGEQIAYYWWNPYHTFDLCLIDVKNPSPRILHKQEGVEVYPMTWLSDRELITIRQNRKTETTDINSFNVLDGTFDDLKTFEGRKWAQIATSPDEKLMAYDFADETNHGNFDINILPLDGSSEISLVNHPANDRVLGWVPGRSEFLFISDRSGTWDLWALPVDNGKSSGPVKRIYTNIGEVEPMGFIENGDCFVGFSRRNFYTYIVPFNKVTGSLNEESGKTIVGSNLRLDWSPDGQYLAYSKEAENSLKLTIQDLRTGAERQIADSLGIIALPRWSPDGKSILVFGFEKNKFRTKGYKGGFYTVDASTGQINEILLLANYKFNAQEDDRLPISGHEWSSDGKSIYILFHQDRLMKYDLQTGQEETLYIHPDLANYVLKLSPDGKRLLFGLHHPGEEKSHLLTIPAAGGKVIELCTSQEAEDFSQVICSPDGKYIYFTERPDETNLWRIPAEGGKPQKVWSSEKRAEMFSIHPDGDQIAFSVRERTTEIRAIENLSRELARTYDKNE